MINTMKTLFVTFSLIGLLLASPHSHADSVDLIHQKQWIHGAEKCRRDNNPPLDILEVDPNTYILRQNKCINAKAPFIYVLFGQQVVLIQDTGATESAKKFPIYSRIRQLVERWKFDNKVETLSIIVTHSHHHEEQTAGDKQFKDKPDVLLVEANAASMQTFFNFEDWPNSNHDINLGGRKLTFIPIPGHQEESLAVYDHNTQFLLTGGTVQPGYLTMNDWSDFQSSINKLATFSETHPIKAILGSHIEMTKQAKVAYPEDESYQPDETSLALSVKDLIELNDAVQAMGDKPKVQALDHLIIAPAKPRRLINIFRRK